MARHPEAPAPEPTDAASAEAEPGLTIDELAAESGVPSRTIRFYQSKGVLPAPTMRGRVAFYGPSHAQRLELIAQLQDRGLKIDAIRDLTQRIDKGELDVGEWLGLESELTAPWAHDTPRTLTEAELTELLGQKRPGQIAELVRLGVVERRGDVYLVGSPALLNVGVKLGQAGIDLATAVGAQLILRKYLARAAQELVDHFLAAASRGDLSLEKESDLARIFEALRPTGTEAVRVVFGQEMERVLRTLATSGKAHQLPRARKRR